MNDQEDSNVNTRLWGGDSLGDYNSEWLNMLSKKFSFQGKIIRQRVRGKCDTQSENDG